MVNLLSQFEVAAGSVTGREHQRLGKNNQDAYSYELTDQRAIAIVCDGCGSGRYSEVGARLGAQLTVRAIAHMLDQGTSLSPWDDGFWRQVQQYLLEQLAILADLAGGYHPAAIRDYWLFTLVGALVTPAETTLFALGDGVIALNGNVQPLGPFPQNQPPYLAYGLLADYLPEAAAAAQMRVLQQAPTDQVQSILLGSDGVMDLVQATHRALPGKAELVGDISQFWQQDRFFANPDMVRRRLALINREVVQPDWGGRCLVRQAGLLPDDTTLVVLRRRLAAGAASSMEV